MYHAISPHDELDEAYVTHTERVATRLTGQLFLLVVALCALFAACICTWRRVRTCCVRGALRLKVYVWLKCALICGCCCEGPAAPYAAKPRRHWWHRGMLRLASGDDDNNQSVGCSRVVPAGGFSARPDEGRCSCLVLTWVGSACHRLRTGCGGGCHRLLAICGLCDGPHAHFAVSSSSWSSCFAECFARNCRMRCCAGCTVPGSRLCSWLSSSLSSLLCQLLRALRGAEVSKTTPSKLAPRGAKLATLEPVEPDCADAPVRNIELGVPNNGSLPHTIASSFRPQHHPQQRLAGEAGAHQVLYGQAFLARMQALQSNGTHAGPSIRGTSMRSTLSSILPTVGGAPVLGGSRDMESDAGSSPPSAPRGRVGADGRPKSAVCYPPIEFDL